MKTLNFCLVILCLGSAPLPGVSQSVSPPPLRHHRSSDDPIVMADDQLIEAITKPTIAIEDLTDEEVAGVYARRMVSHPASPLRPIVDKDLLTRPNAWRILLEILKLPKHNGVRGGLWGWLSRHPDFPHITDLLAESIQIFEAEGRTLEASPLFGLADFIAYVGTPEQAKLLDELEKAGAIGIELARSRYAKRMQAENEQTRQTARMANGNVESAASGSRNHNSIGAKPEASSQEPASISWSMIVVLIVAGIGLQWFLLKARK